MGCFFVRGSGEEIDRAGWIHVKASSGLGISQTSVWRVALELVWQMP